MPSPATSTRSHVAVETKTAIGVPEIGGFARRSHPAVASAAASMAMRMMALSRIMARARDAPAVTAAATNSAKIG